VNRSFNRSRTRGLWDSKRNSTGQQCLGIWDAYAQGRDGLLDDLMAQAESKIRELEIIQPPSPVIRTVDPSIVRKPQRRRERQEVEVAELPGQVDRNDAVNELEQAA
jgi:hypothetical protein